jgi:NitT/TauT family transport system substrate-binding protein
MTQAPPIVPNSRMERSFMRHTAQLAVLAAIVAAAPQAAWADDKVSFITSWTAEAEHGGFYQAVANGIYKKHGIEPTLRQGGPQLNSAQLLAAGAVDFRVASNNASGFNAVQQGIPLIVVAAFFQKDPAVIIAHPDAGNDTLEAMKGKPIAISQQSVDTWWRFLVAKYGFTDSQIRPYTFQIAPFLVDKKAIQQGYITSEPYAIEQNGGFKPKTILLADAGYDAYATTIEVSLKMVQEKPELVQRFVDATIEGWYAYMYGDPKPANALIVKDNPDMTQGQIDFSMAAMKEHGIIDSGDSEKLGIGAMTDARWKSFFDLEVSLGLYPADLDYKKAYTMQFVNKGHGLEMKK